MRYWVPDQIDRFISWLYTTRIYGTRSPDYVSGCAGCEAWRLHDALFNGAGWEDDPQGNAD